MRGLYVKLLLIALGFALILAIPGLLDRVRAEPRNERIKKRFSRELASDVSVRRHGVYGVDFVRCGSCRIEKLKHGPFTFGGLNVLVLEDLAVVIPPREREEDLASAPAGAREIAAGLGVDDDFLRTQGTGLRFSGLRVVWFALSRLEGTNVVKVLSAASGEAREDGLHLVDCDIITSNATFRAESAILKHKPHLRLEWSGGSVDLQ